MKMDPKTAVKAFTTRVFGADRAKEEKEKLNDFLNGYPTPTGDQRDKKLNQEKGQK